MHPHLKGIKLPAMQSPSRGDVIMFETPEYVSRGVWFETLSRVVFMGTFSLVNLDRDENGDPRAQFFVKRCLGIGGDLVSIDPISGEFLIRPAGESHFEHEGSIIGDDYSLRRLVAPDRGSVIRDAANFVAVASAAGATRALPPHASSLTGWEAESQVFRYWFHRQQMKIDPRATIPSQSFYRIENGNYVPEGRVFPIGDNRDNSHDGRYFGPVSTRSLLGRPLLRFWPLGRFGGVR